jgi:signal peptidase I
MRPTAVPERERDHDTVSNHPPADTESTSRRGLIRWGACAVLVAVLGLLTHAYVAEVVRIPTSSMAQTLLPGEHVLVDKATRVARPWHRGDVVLFRAPRSGVLTLKRVVALAGDKVELRDGELFVNNRRVPEQYVVPGVLDSVYFGPKVVAQDEVFVLGDNRGNSLDSRRYGGVPVSQIEGRAVLVLWPLHRAGGIR